MPWTKAIHLFSAKARYLSDVLSAAILSTKAIAYGVDSESVALLRPRWQCCCEGGGPASMYDKEPPNDVGQLLFMLDFTVDCGDH